MARRWTVLPAAAMVTCLTSGWLLQQQVDAGGDVYQPARVFGATVPLRFRLTLGMGIVQTVFTLAPDLALGRTTARWFAPSGRSIQGTLVVSEAMLVEVGGDSRRGE